MVTPYWIIYIMCEVADWINLAQVGILWRAVVKTAMNPLES